jgi:replicative DNA helicase
VPILRMEDFYADAHQKIFETIIALPDKGKPVDVVTLADELKLRGYIEDVGGYGYLAELWDAAPTAANAEYYARIVHDKAKVRNLIHAGNEILTEAYNQTMPADQLVESAERLILDVAEKGTTANLSTLAEAIDETYDRIDKRNSGEQMAFSGLSTGFADLNELTAGLQKSELVIVAARPSVGKCLVAGSEIVLEDGSVATIEEIYRRQNARLLTLSEEYRFAWTAPSAFVDDGCKPVYRVTTRLGRTVEATAAHPFLTIDGWKPLEQLAVGEHIAVPRVLPVFGATLMRECEIKLLVERATNHSVPQCVFRLPRPQVALFLNRLFSGDGFSLHSKSGYPEISYQTVSERLARQVQHLLLRFGVVAQLGKRAARSAPGARSLWRLRLRGSSFHRFANEIGVFGKEEALARLAPTFAGKSNNPREVGHVREDSTQGMLASSWDVDAALLAVARPQLAQGDVLWDKIKSIEFQGSKQVYDLTIPETHNFVANDICVHNTAFSLGLVRNIVIGEREPVFFVSLEQSRAEIAERLLCSQARVDSHRLRKGTLTTEDMEKLIEAGNTLRSAKLFIDDTPAQGMLRIAANARRLATRQGIKLVVIDYLQLIEPENRRDPRQEQVAQISRRLKFLARELKIPVIALAQVNRSAEDRQDHRPRLSDLRESGSIEQDADAVFLLHRPDRYEPGQHEGIIEVIVAKNRNGPVGEVTLAYIKQYLRFEDFKPGTPFDG